VRGEHSSRCGATSRLVLELWRWFACLTDGHGTLRIPVAYRCSPMQLFRLVLMPLSVRYSVCMLYRSIIESRGRLSALTSGPLPPSELPGAMRWSGVFVGQGWKTRRKSYYLCGGSHPYAHDMLPMCLSPWSAVRFFVRPPTIATSSG